MSVFSFNTLRASTMLGCWRTNRDQPFKFYAAVIRDSGWIVCWYWAMPGVKSRRWSGQSSHFHRTSICIEIIRIFSQTLAAEWLKFNFRLNLHLRLDACSLKI